MADPDDGETRTSGFTEDQRSELAELIREAVGSAKPPDTPKAADAPKVSDAEWDRMSDRQRESWVRQLVDFRLDELSREDADARRDAEIKALQDANTPEPEAPPSVVSKVQRWLWGDPDKK